MSEYDFFIASMPTSRPADYYLGCLDGSVFMDFNDTLDGLALVRISFDGYGCCNFINNSIPLDRELSDIFKEILQSPVLDQNMLERIIKKAILINVSSIWEEALREYGLI